MYLVSPKEVLQVRVRKGRSQILSREKATRPSVGALPHGVAPLVPEEPVVFWTPDGPIKPDESPIGQLWYKKGGQTRSLGQQKGGVQYPYWAPGKQFVFLNFDRPFRGGGVLCHPDTGWLFNVRYKNCFWQPHPSSNNEARMVCQKTEDEVLLEEQTRLGSKRPYRLLTLTKPGTGRPTVTERAIGDREVDALFGSTYRAIVEENTLRQGDDGELVLSYDGSIALLQDLMLDVLAPPENRLAPGGRMFYVMMRGRKRTEHVFRVGTGQGYSPYINFIGWTHNSRYLIGQHAIGRATPSDTVEAGAVVAAEPQTWKKTILYIPPPSFDLVGFLEESQ